MAGINGRPITEVAKPSLTGTNTWQGPGFLNMHYVDYPWRKLNKKE